MSFIRVESDVNRIWIETDDTGKMTIFKDIGILPKILELVNIYSEISDVVPKFSIDNECAKFEFITFNNPELYSKYQNYGALGLYTINNKLPNTVIPNFLEKVDIESLCKVLLFAIVCGYRDFANRNIMLRFHDNKISFVLIDFEHAFKFCDRAMSTDLLDFGKVSKELMKLVHFDKKMIDYVRNTTLENQSLFTKRHVRHITIFLDMLEKKDGLHSDILREFLDEWWNLDAYEKMYNEK